MRKKIFSSDVTLKYLFPIFFLWFQSNKYVHTYTTPCVSYIQSTIRNSLVVLLTNGTNMLEWMHPLWSSSSIAAIVLHVKKYWARYTVVIVSVFFDPVLMHAQMKPTYLADWAKISFIRALAQGYIACRMADVLAKWTTNICLKHRSMLCMYVLYVRTWLVTYSWKKVKSLSENYWRAGTTLVLALYFVFLVLY